MMPTVSNSSILTFERSSCNDLHSCRTIWNIIWSCLASLFACVWLSVHPNIPAPEDSWGRKATRRVWTMIAALFAPELLVGWAMRQWVLSSQIAKENKKYGWTKTHGFFVVMGGFMECDRDGLPIRTVTVRRVDTIPKKTKRRLREVEITDKSKGDVLSKTFAILQTTWFILQCISRSVENLPVTELEIATVAFCVLNFATYILWWNKPLNVSSPLWVYAAADREMAEEEVQEVEVKKERWTDTYRSTWKAFERGLADIPKEVYRPIAALVKSDGFKTIVRFPFYLIKIILYGESYKSNPRRVGTFGPEYDTNLDVITSGVVGTVFGAIHCTIWATQFPSHTEQLLWRIAAISVTAVPILIVVVVWVDSQDFKTFVLHWLIVFTIAVACVLYVFARLTLLVLPLMSLRSLPPGAFNSVNWIRFIPHV